MNTDMNEINKFSNDLLDLLEKYKKKLPIYEVGNILISRSVNAMLQCAPNYLVAIKTIMGSIEIGIQSFQDENT